MLVYIFILIDHIVPYIGDMLTLIDQNLVTWFLLVKKYQRFSNNLNDKA